ncbi:autotransporter secretion outer membrane protein TamA [Hephaestia caeni]|uniref:Autotransporter secretion outer membrane protein TamA n=2 Tax=Hephaestia caeni TaxID=645617 RepID=A0A397PIM0_9SPHN|nr:autotransporter secretion outer membrane protein TamA [Hephaestia caeni]
MGYRGFAISALAGVSMVPLAAFAQVTPDPVEPGQAAPAMQTAPEDGTTEAAAPIIPDATFEDALPPLSDDLNAPLEAMPTLDQPQTTPPGEMVQQVPGTPEAAASDALGAAPAQDPELAQPLPPLSTFDATPPAEVADEGANQKAVEIRYGVVVKGLDEIDAEDQFRSLSALEEGDGKAANAAMIAARAREDEALAVRIMKARGYYDASAISTIDQVPNQPGRVSVTLSATPGHLYKLGEIAVKAAPTVPPDLIRTNLPLKAGDPIEADRIQGAEANVSLTLPQMGYPFVKLGTRDILLDGETYVGDYTLPVDTGPRSSFGTISTRGDLAFDAEHVDVLKRFEAGDLYDSRKVDDLRDALVATGLFSTVSVIPRRSHEPGPDDTERVDFVVRQNAGPPRTLAGAIGYNTGEGAQVRGSWTHRNLFPPEGALIVDGILGTQQQGAGVTFRRSNAGRRDKTFSLIARADHSNYDAFDAFTGTLSARWSYDSTPIWQKKFTYSYGVDLIGTNESVYDFAAGERKRGTYGILALPGQVQFDTSDDLMNPTTGYRLKLVLSPETSVRGAVRPYARTLVEASAYYPVSDSLTIAGRVRAGSIFGIDRDDLAPSRRYYGGGGGSVRGYGYQRLGPFDPNGDPVGGRSINEFALEARYRFGNFGIVPFVDAGNAYESTFPKGSDLRFGAGIGARYYTNFGPLRIDVATPLNPRPGDGRIALYISIGQAF